MLHLSLFYSIDTIELLLPCGFDTLEYSWVKATIGICMLADYSMAKKHQQAFWRRCRGSQLSLSVYRLSKIALVNIINLTELSFALCLLMVFTGKCMTGFNLPANYHSDLKSLLRKSRSRLSSPGSSRSYVREIIYQFQGQQHLLNQY